MTLYSKARPTPTPTLARESVEGEAPVSEVDSSQIDQDLAKLDHLLFSVKSAELVSEMISTEAVNIKDESTRRMYGMFLQQLGANLGLRALKGVSLEAHINDVRMAEHEHLALEGFLADMWKTTRDFFVKLYERIKAFMTKHFTRLGRVKNKLTNLASVLGETKASLQTTSLTSVPSALGTKFPVDSVTASYVGLVLANISKAASAVGDLTNEARKVIEATGISATELSKLKEQIRTAKLQKDSVDNELDKSGMALPFSEKAKQNASLKKTSSTLGDTIKTAEKDLDKNTSGAKDTTTGKFAAKGDLSSDVVQTEVAQGYVKVIEAMLSPLKNKAFAGGMTITKFEVTPEGGISLEQSDNKAEPGTVVLLEKGALMTLVKNSLSLIENCEKDYADYGKLNDEIMASLDKVDTTISSLEKEGGTGAGEARLKGLLTNTIKPRMAVMKNVFSGYNKLCKLVFDQSVECGEGVVVYGTLCLKHYG